MFDTIDAITPQRYKPLVLYKSIACNEQVAIREHCRCLLEKFLLPIKLFSLNESF